MHLDETSSGSLSVYLKALSQDIYRPKRTRVVHSLICINRPGVAGAGLQTGLLQTYLLTDAIPPTSFKQSHDKTVGVRKLKLSHNNPPQECRLNTIQ